MNDLNQRGYDEENVVNSSLQHITDVLVLRRPFFFHCCDRILEFNLATNVHCFEVFKRGCLIDRKSKFKTNKFIQSRSGRRCGLLDSLILLNGLMIRNESSHSDITISRNLVGPRIGFRFNITLNQIH